MAASEEHQGNDCLFRGSSPPNNNPSMSIMLQSAACASYMLPRPHLCTTWRAHTNKDVYSPPSLQADTLVTMNLDRSCLRVKEERSAGSEFSESESQREVCLWLCRLLCWLARNHAPGRGCNAHTAHSCLTVDTTMCRWLRAAAVRCWDGMGGCMPL